MRLGWFQPLPVETRTLLSVQALRAFAALCVVVHHAGYDADTLAGRFGLAHLDLDRFFDWTFGIHLFFVISGFIMVRTTAGFGTAGAPARFLARRLQRIVPLYWLLTGLVLLGASVAPSLLNVPIGGWGLALGSFLFVPLERVNGEIRPVLGQGWTLNYEMFFYVLFAAAMALPRRAGLGSLAVTLLGLASVGAFMHPSVPALVVWTDGLLLDFLIGIGVGLLAEAGLRLDRLAALAIGIGGLTAAILLGPAEGPIGRVTEGLSAGLIVGAGVLGPAWPARAAVLALGALGDASYSLYLVHPFTIRLLRVGWASAVGDRWPLGLFVLIAVLGAILTALLAFRWIERPMTRALHRRFPTAERHVDSRARPFVSEPR